MSDKITRLRELYLNSSKHSNYQILASDVSRVLDLSDKDVKSRYERERLDFILQHIEPSDQVILDIGGNTGYFTFEFLKEGARKVVYYEGNSTHAQFVDALSDLLGRKDQIEIHPSYFDFQNSNDRSYDAVLLLNVIHHLGDDFGGRTLTMEEAKAKMIEKINGLAKIANTLVLQMGFCWKGDRNLLLFDQGTKSDMISFIETGTRDYWKISAIGIAEGSRENIQYKTVDESNLDRNDALGEFLNRPIFILNSLHC